MGKDCTGLVYEALAKGAGLYPLSLPLHLHGQGQGPRPARQALDAPGVDAGAHGDRRGRVYPRQDGGEDKRGGVRRGKLVSLISLTYN